MREFVHVALLAGLLAVGTAQADRGLESGSDTTPSVEGVSSEPMTREQARERLIELLFRDDIDRIDFQATTFEAGSAMIRSTCDTILDLGLPVLGDPGEVAEKGTEIVQALNAGTMRGLQGTFQKNKQAIVIQDASEARMLGRVVGKAMSIIHAQFGSGSVSYRDRAAELFSHARSDPDENLSVLEQYLATVEWVETLSPDQRARYFE